MFERLKLVTPLIQEGDYEIAGQLLEKEKAFDEKTAYVLSLLYRLSNDFGKEENIIKNSKFQTPYFNERRQWYTLSSFDRLVPRTIIKLEKKPDQTPKKETLDKLCFVTCASKDNYEWCVESIESIKHTPTYSNKPYILVDLGLTDNQKNDLLTNQGVTRIVQPKSQNLPTQLKLDVKFIANHNYMFFDELCPEYEYIVHIETDTWIQDERGIDQLLCACEKQGFVWPRIMGIEHGKWSWLFHYSFFAVKQGCIFWQHVKKVYLQELEFRLKNNLPVPYALAEQVLHDIHPHNKRFLLGDFNINYLDGPHNVPLFNVGLPVVDKNDPHQLLRLPQTNEVMTSLHVQGNCPYARQNDLNRFFHTRSFDELPKENELAQHIQTSQQYLANGHRPNDSAYDQKISLRFRVVPWEDKEQLKEILKREVTQ